MHAFQMIANHASLASTRKSPLDILPMMVSLHMAICCCNNLQMTCALPLATGETGPTSSFLLLVVCVITVGVWALGLCGVNIHNCQAVVAALASEVSKADAEDCSLGSWLGLLLNYQQLASSRLRSRDISRRPDAAKLARIRRRKIDSK